MSDSQPKIVLVEDNEMLAEIYQTLLVSEGFSVEVAHDGEAGAKLIKKVVPDLVLLDIMLPKLSGDQVLYEIRSDAKCKDIKVIMLTNISETEAPEGIERLGFSRYIVKANLQSEQLPAICRETIAETPDENAELKAL